MSYEIAEVLDGAADVIERDGWCQNDFATPAGQVCAMGAIAEAIGIRDGDHWARVPLDHDGHRLAQGASAALARVIPVPDKYAPVPIWNDEPGRTEQEVLDALRLAAKEERIKADAVPAPLTHELTPDALEVYADANDAPVVQVGGRFCVATVVDGEPVTFWATA